MSKADDIFWREFGVILLLLSGFAVGMFLIARAIGVSTMERIHTGATAVAMRIEPVGRVRIGDPTQQVGVEAMEVALAADTPPATSAAPESPAGTAAVDPGKAVYDSLCQACHAGGIAGAPKLDDVAGWTERMAKGLDGLVAAAIQGMGGMPPRGGNPTLTDEEIRQAIEYMLEQAGVPAG